MPFLIFSNVNKQFGEKELEWRSYITIKTLSTAKKMEFINKREFIAVVLDKNAKMFMVHVVTLLAAPTI